MTVSFNRSAIVGRTGFVGKTLMRSFDFSDAFNSSDISSIRGKHYDLLICAGAPAAKWIANRNPEADWENLRSLIDNLKTVQADRFILISTVDVYRNPVGVTELNVPRVEDLQEAYGRHRRILEESVVALFPNATVVRLPALFGSGLKKNVIFDLMTGNMTERISPHSRFQWYPMRRLSADVEKILQAERGIINVAIEPIETLRIAEKFFPSVKIGGPELHSAFYDMRTAYPDVLGSSGEYHIYETAVMNELDAFLGEVL